jgi:nucleotide-binding universal stress UspA family protein
VSEPVPKRVVIAVDLEERTLDALALGRNLAGAAGAPATVVSVFHYVALLDPAGRELPRLVADGEKTLAGLAGQAGLQDAAVEAVPGAFAARELQRISERPDCGAIVVGSTTRGPLGRLLVGGVGERLLGGAACPVAIAPRGYGDAPASRLARVGIGFDGSDEARRALEAAVALTRTAGAELRVITAFQPLAFGGVPTSALPGASANDTMRAELRTLHDEALAATGEGVRVEGRFVEGSADEVLRDQSAELDLLVAGSRGYGPRGAVLMGSATTALARGAACPILVTPRGTRFDLLD